MNFLVLGTCNLIVTMWELWWDMTDVKKINLTSDKVDEAMHKLVDGDVGSCFGGGTAIVSSECRCI